MKIAVLPGDGIGPEIVAEAVKVLNALGPKFDLETAPVGGAAYDVAGHPLPPATLELAKKAEGLKEDVSDHLKKVKEGFSRNR